MDLAKSNARAERRLQTNITSNDVLWHFFMQNTRLLQTSMDMATIKEMTRNGQLHIDVGSRKDLTAESPCNDRKIKAPSSRLRTNFSPHQLSRLEEQFHSCHYPDLWLRQQISAELNLDEYRVQVWFQNRRSRLRREQARLNTSSNSGNSTDDSMTFLGTTKITQV